MEPVNNVMKEISFPTITKAPKEESGVTKTFFEKVSQDQSAVKNVLSASKALDNTDFKMTPSEKKRFSDDLDNFVAIHKNELKGLIDPKIYNGLMIFGGDN